MPEQAVAINGYDPDVVSNIVSKLEGLHDELASERGEYMQRCRVIRGNIADVLQAAKDEDGISKKALKLVIKERQLEAKLADLRDDLEPDDGAAYQHLVAALGEFGDTPLGNAAKLAADMDRDAKRKGRGRKRSEPETIEGEWSEAATA
jgi:predicted KAP-like P-loop ATPase